MPPAGTAFHAPARRARGWIACLACLVFIAATRGQAFAQAFSTSPLPIVLLNTGGQVIPNDPRITVSMCIVDNGAGMLNHVTDSCNGYDGLVTIEIRGSSSQQYPKKSYGFTPVDSAGIRLNVPLLQMPAENDWILYAPYPDKTLLRNSLAYALPRLMGHYTSRTRHVEVVLNGAYQGVYELHEKIKRDKNRVDIAKVTPADTVGDELTGGYIIKIDKITGSGSLLWYSAFDPKVHFQYHDPEDSELLPVQQSYIQDYVYGFEAALQSPMFADPDSGWRRYADELSFIDFFILQELGHTVDGYRSSTFLYKDKDSKGGKLTMGPMWDFNLSYGNADYCAAFDTAGWQYQFNALCPNYAPHVPFWWDRLLQDPAFAGNLRCRWTQLRQGILHTDTINHWIDSVAAFLKDAWPRNFVKWPILGQYVNWNYFIGQTYPDEVDYMKTWIAHRSAWIDGHLPGNCLVAALPPMDRPSIAVRPNPFRDRAVLSIEGTSLPGSVMFLQDLAGMTVRRIDCPSTGNGCVLERGDLPAGLYLLTVITPSGTATAKVVISG